MEDSDRNTDTDEDTTWDPNPLPLMVKHPPRVTTSNTKMQPDREGFLSQTCPKGENDLGWVQLQQKSYNRRRVRRTFPNKHWVISNILAKP
jgi:hypothetical protein